MYNCDSGEKQTVKISPCKTVAFLFDEKKYNPLKYRLSNEWDKKFTSVCIANEFDFCRVQLRVQQKRKCGRYLGNHRII